MAARYRQAERLARFRKRKRAGFPVVMSEGDSWFSYEFYPNIIDRLDDEEMFAHLRLEMSGDTVANMAGTDETVQSLRDLARHEEALFLLFSGGGNDIQQAARRWEEPGGGGPLFQNGAEPDDCIVPERSDELFGALRTGYERLIRIVGPEAPVVTHGYDWFQPRPEPVRVLGMDIHIGPWIQPQMVKAGIVDAALQRGTADVLVNRFNDILAQLQTDHPRDFVYVNLRGTLNPQTEWENEIHPTEDGFRKVEEKFRDVIFDRVHALLLTRGDL